MKHGLHKVLALVIAFSALISISSNTPKVGAQSSLPSEVTRFQVDPPNSWSFISDMAVDPVAKKLYVENGEHIKMYNTQTYQLLDDNNVIGGVEASISALALDTSKNYLFVGGDAGLPPSSWVTVFDSRTNRSTNQHVTGLSGGGVSSLMVNTSNNTLYVANYPADDLSGGPTIPGHISVVDESTLNTIKTINFGNDFPGHMSMSTSLGYIFVTNIPSNNVYETKLWEMNETTYNPGYPVLVNMAVTSIKFSEKDGVLYLAGVRQDKSFWVYAYSLSLNKVKEVQINASSNANYHSDIELLPELNRMYVSSGNALYVVKTPDIVNLGTVYNVAAGEVAVDSDNSRIFAVNTVNNGDELIVLQDIVPLIEPVIFIPGIMGSKLVENLSNIDQSTHTELWPGILQFSDPLKDRLLLPSNRDISATYPVEQAYGGFLDYLRSMGYHEAFVDADIKLTPVDRCWSFSNEKTSLYVFAYDWRLDIDTADDKGPVQQLKQLVDCVEAKHPGTKVNIVTHSMGGLVARKYILHNPGTHNVHKLITIAAPWLGAPQFVNVLLTGDALQGDLLPAIGVHLYPAKIRELVKTFPGGWELGPSKAYFDLGGDPPLESYSYPAYKAWLDYNFTNAASVNEAFHAGQQDDWRDDGSGVQYYQIYGRYDDKTVYSMRYGEYLNCKRTKIPFTNIDIWTCDTVNPTVIGYYIDKWGPGDTTVPVLSASRIGNSNYNAPYAQIWLAQDGVHNNEPSNWGTISHSNLVNNSYIRDCITLFVMNSGGCGLTRIPNGAAAMSVQSAQTQATAASYFINIRGVPDVTVSDSYGNSTNTVSGTLTTPVPDIAVHQLNTGQYLVLKDSQPYTVTFRTGDSPLFVEVKHGTGSSTPQTVRYLDLNLPANVNAQLKVSVQGIEALRYDDGSGGFAHVVNPTVNVSGSQANNTEPPALSISKTGALNAQTVTISAHAVGMSNSISRIYFSLDGTNFQQYTSPLQIDATQKPTIYAFADDIVGNRSSLVVYSLVKRVFIPFSRR